ncbi:MAG TPA: uL15m family ribosomal protein [Patescibacteria group bacterium]|nr:uL15m family ribosomal protein [Patescibacteria group bacterium]
MKLHELQKVVGNKSKAQRRGRGYGSGRGGHTVGRGSKGQNARGKVALWFEGTKIKKSLLKRLPMQRGKGKLKPSTGPMEINLKYLNILPANSTVDIDLLVKHGIVKEEDAKSLGVKILGGGDLQVPLTILVPMTSGAKKKVDKLGGATKKEEKVKGAKEQKDS